MRVLLIDLNGPFGPLRSFVELLPAFKSLGVAVEFVVPDRSLDLLDEVAPHASVFVVNRRHSLRRDWEVSRIVQSRLAAGTHIVHANSTTAVRGASLGALIKCAPLVVHLRNSSLSRLERSMLRSVARLPGKVRYIAVSKGAADLVGRMPEGLVTTLGDPVSAPQPRGPRGWNELPRIGVVLNQLPTKGLDIFVDIVSILKGLNIQWEVFGSAGEKSSTSKYVVDSIERLERLQINGGIRYMGVVPSMSSVFCSLDVALVTSRRESFSRICAEALLAGTPLVAPDIPGLIDTVDGGRLAQMYPPGDPAAAAASIRRVLNDLPSALDRSRTGMQWGSGKFSPEVVAVEMAGIYRGILCGPGPAT